MFFCKFGKFLCNGNGHSDGRKVEQGRGYDVEIRKSISFTIKFSFDSAVLD